MLAALAACQRVPGVSRSQINFLQLKIIYRYAYKLLQKIIVFMIIYI
jgi:hypothetical protein